MAKPGDLTVSGGGSVVVASDAVLGQLAALEALETTLEGASTELRWLATLAGNDDTELWIAHAAVVRSREHCAVITSGVRASLIAYGGAEDAAQRIARALAAKLGFALGALSPLLLAIAAPALTGAALGLAVARALGAGTNDDPLSVLRTHNRVLSDPVTVALVRAGVMSADDFLGGVFRLPSGVIDALGEQGLGVTGLSTSAALVVLLGRGAGALTETPIAVRTTSVARVAPARSLSDRLARIPVRSATGEQVRIDRYRSHGKPDRFEVYIGGTLDFSTTASTEPWDMTSNLSAVAGLPAGSYLAVRQAMARAGVTASTPVTITGYSQGGLIAARIAASGDYRVSGLVTFGAPSGQVAIPREIPVLSVRHSEDIVPATGGFEVNPHAVVVERALHSQGPPPEGVAVPAHAIAEYARTAQMMDEAQSPAVRSAIDALTPVLEAESEPVVRSTTYRATRVVELEPTTSGR